MSVIKGNILISAETGSFFGGTGHIYLEDTSRADAPAEIIAETGIEGIKHSYNLLKKQTTIPFQLSFDEMQIDPRNIYSIRVWIDKDNNGKQNEWDLYSDEFYPVLTHNAGVFVEIRVVASG